MIVEGILPHKCPRNWLKPPDRNGGSSPGVYPEGGLGARRSGVPPELAEDRDRGAGSDLGSLGALEPQIGSPLWC